MNPTTAASKFTEKAHPEELKGPIHRYLNWLGYWVVYHAITAQVHWDVHSNVYQLPFLTVNRSMFDALAELQLDTHPGIDAWLLASER